MKMIIDRVTDIALEYLKKAGYTWMKVTRVASDESALKWKVYADVGIIFSEIKVITIDDRDGRVIGYE